MDVSAQEINPTSKSHRPVDFVITLFKDTLHWFFKGIGSCASLVLGYFFVTAAILVTIVALSSGSEYPDSDTAGQELFRDYGGESKLALIELAGLILEKEEPAGLYGGGQVITPAKVESAFKTVRDDDTFKGVVVLVSSPGGSPVASDMIYEIITDFKKDSNLPVVFLMGDVAASGGYYISAAGDYIFAHPSTITGSIGVIMETYNLSGLYEKVGVKKETFKAGKYKDILNDSRDATDEERAIVNSLINDAYGMFVQRVSEGRNISLDRVKEIAQGKIYSGISAKEVGLIDQLGTLDSALAYTASKANIEKYKVVKVSTGSVWSELFSGITYALHNTGIKLGIAEVESPKYRILFKLD